MGVELPSRSRSALGSRLEELSPEPLGEAAITSLWHHYEELRRWSPRLGLIGAGTADEVLERHYAESLAALPLVPKRGVLVDVGSGAGFPGLVLAAARPELEAHLFESRQRKWAFLAAACRRAESSCRCHGGRVEHPLPPTMPEVLDVVTSRAVALSEKVLSALAGRLDPGGRLLLWVGERDPELPPELEISEALGLAGSHHRRIVVAERANP